MEEGRRKMVHGKEVFPETLAEPALCAGISSGGAVRTNIPDVALVLEEISLMADG